MRQPRIRASALVPALLLLSVLAAPGAAAQRLEPVASGLRQPVAVAQAGDGRLFIVQQAGEIVVLQDGKLLDPPFLDLSSKTRAGGERGVLGLAFPPDYAASGRFYVYYTDENGTSTLSRFSVSDRPNRADPGSERVLRTVPQPYANHNGGQLAFGPDGYLYWGLGDGGSGGDPHGNGQDTSTPLAAIVRLDVAGDGAEAAPGNPFEGGGGDPDVWVYGLRNPWRFSFDRATGDLYIGDVGQGAYEEIDRLDAGTGGGTNFGWNVMEGLHCFSPKRACDESGLTPPIVEYPHASDWGNSVTGGYVYRGTTVAALAGAYLFADFGSGRVWTARERDGSWTVELLLETGFNVSTFAEDARGELYLADYGGGVLYRIAP